ncbi:amidase family protein [Shinella sp.]|uniref:amidase family protein n=1 Tax=unclassified Shinella TaxID=2643062 RepID=UPI0039186133
MARQRFRLASGELCDDFASLMGRFDAVITTASASEAPRMDDVTFWDDLEKSSFALPWNLTGYPAIAICMGFGPQGLPLAVQVGGRPFDEPTLFQVVSLRRLESLRSCSFTWCEVEWEGDYVQAPKAWP